MRFVVLVVICQLFASACGPKVDLSLTTGADGGGTIPVAVPRFTPFEPCDLQDDIASPKAHQLMASVLVRLGNGNPAFSGYHAVESLCLGVGPGLFSNFKAYSQMGRIFADKSAFGLYDDAIQLLGVLAHEAAHVLPELQQRRPAVADRAPLLFEATPPIGEVRAELGLGG